MKIRTDFVTNSSSYNTAVVIIENPVLLEILQKYKDMGLFGENKPFFGIGSYDSYAHDYFGVPHDVDDDLRTPAFYFFEDDDESYRSDDLAYGTPGSLDSVLGDIISIMEGGKKYLDEGLLTELKKELIQKNDEIKPAYLKVHWRNDQLWDDGESESEYEYDPVNGEKRFYKSPEEIRFYDILESGDLEEIEELREDLGYGENGNENDDFWEYAKRVGYIDNFDNFPMDEYNKYKETGEIKLCEEWLDRFGNEEVENENDEDKGEEAE